MNHVFISHSHADSDFAEILDNKVTEGGFTVWRDVVIHGGADWRKEIDLAIKDAFALIVIMTPEAKASEYVTYEWAFAWGAGVKVIPIMLRKTESHPRLEALQYLDFTNRIARPWDSLLKLLSEAEVSKPQEVKAIKPELIQKETGDGSGAYKRMIEALNDEGWPWRSIERLAIIGGVSEDKALEILRHDSNVTFGKGKSGQRIAQLKKK
ncbi:MAG: toll/interleukin-1 receptor domain-containing protein [Chlorobium sp.]